MPREDNNKKQSVDTDSVKSNIRTTRALSSKPTSASDQSDSDVKKDTREKRRAIATASRQKNEKEEPDSSIVNGTVKSDHVPIKEPRKKRGMVATLRTTKPMGAIEIKNRKKGGAHVSHKDMNKETPNIKNNTEESSAHQSKDKVIPSGVSLKRARSILDLENEKQNREKAVNGGNVNEEEEENEEEEPVVEMTAEELQTKKRRLSVARSKRRIKIQERAAKGLLVQIPENATLKEQVSLVSRFKVFQGEKALLEEQRSSEKKEKDIFSIPKARMVDLICETVQNLDKRSDRDSPEGRKIRFSRMAIEALRKAAETEMVTLFNLANHIAMVGPGRNVPPGGAVTVNTDQIKLANAVLTESVGRWGSIYNDAAPFQPRKERKSLNRTIAHPSEKNGSDEEDEDDGGGESHMDWDDTGKEGDDNSKQQPSLPIVESNKKSRSSESSTNKEEEDEEEDNGGVDDDTMV